MESDLNHRLLRRLSAGVASSPELEGALGASQSWVSRTLRRLINDGQVLRMGRARAARYGYRRHIEPIGSQWPLRRIDETGGIHELGTLFSLAADQYHFAPSPGALEPGFAWGGLSEGVPYFLQDQRPGGFLGRAVPLRYPELNLPERVIDWSDDHYLRYLTQRASDAVGDLILGNPAFDQYLTSLRHRNQLLPAERERRYPELADEAMRGGLPGSSAQGEHPKFTALLHDDAGHREVIVKFSPFTDTDAGRRWSDLLNAEHDAHIVLREAGVSACRSEILQWAGRTFLEVERFDRQGSGGRVGVTSLFAIDVTLFGGNKNWIDSAIRLHGDNRIDADTLETVRFVSTFGALIANTDRHFGNLACYDRYDGQFALAPIYDMLPMLFAPAHDQIVARVFEPPDPASETIRCWGRARELAEHYWQTLTENQRISAEFRTICAACLMTLRALPRTGAYANNASCGSPL
jgi:hypothetical protein